MIKKLCLVPAAILLGLGFSQAVMAAPQVLQAQDCPNCAPDNEDNGNAPVENPPATNPGDSYNGEQDNNYENNSDFDNSQDFGQDQSSDEDQENNNQAPAPESGNAPEQNSGYNRNSGN
jgi:hypothetical protein